MSGRILFADAMPRARYLRDILAVACERIEIAGSLRREEPTIKDIELVAIPKVIQVATGLFDEVLDVADELEQRLAEGIAADWLRPRDVAIHRKDGSVETARRMGERYKALEYMGTPVDLFTVRPPADWGVIFTIRTGPAEWSERLVTDMQRHFMRVDQGQLLHAGRHVPCPEESDFFQAIGQPWLEPKYRHPARVDLGGPPA